MVPNRSTYLFDSVSLHLNTLIMGRSRAWIQKCTKVVLRSRMYGLIPLFTTLRALKEHHRIMFHCYLPR